MQIANYLQTSSFLPRAVSLPPVGGFRFLLWYQGFHTGGKAAVKPLPLQFPRSYEVSSCTSQLKAALNPSAGTLARGKAAVTRLVLPCHQWPSVALLSQIKRTAVATVSSLVRFPCHQWVALILLWYTSQGESYNQTTSSSISSLVRFPCHQWAALILLWYTCQGKGCNQATPSSVSSLTRLPCHQWVALILLWHTSQIKGCSQTT